MPRKTTIVTAIPYVNSVPHLGTVLDTLSGDVTARYMRMRGEDVYFVAGADENGLKIKDAADASGTEVHAFVDEISGRFESIFKSMGIEYDAFVRTSKEQHRAVSQEFFRRLQANGYIYQDQYEGWYDTSSETYFKESDLVDGKSPDGNPVRWVSEKNYFFRLSAFQDRLLEHIEANPTFIIPETRKNEVVSFIKQGLRDACVSRSNPGWGIPVPGDEGQVIYVWFDALINYVTASGWPADGWEDKWPPAVQWLGKDILTRFHATLWPAMLWGVGLPLPESVVAHGWILFGGEKLSKSKGVSVGPLELAADLATRSTCAPEVAIDAVRHYLTATMALDSDSSFSFEEFDRKYNADLANDLGNALNRALSMAHKFLAGVVPAEDAEPEVLQAIADARTRYEQAMKCYRLDSASDAAWSLVRFLNKYVDTRAPWALAKNSDAALGGVLRGMLLGIRAAEGLVRPVLPHAADAIAHQLNLPPLTTWSLIGDHSTLPAGTQLNQPKPIFPRLEIAKPVQVAPVAKPIAPPTDKTPVPMEDNLISIDDFVKVKLKIGRVLEAEPLEGSDKLMKLQIVIGDERRQIVAGIRKNYSAEDLIGRQVVVCVNLKPAKLRGAESQGMLLAATDEDGGAILLQPDREAPEGTGVK